MRRSKIKKKRGNNEEKEKWMEEVEECEREGKNRNDEYNAITEKDEG